jgi:hypothetical protein
MALKLPRAKMQEQASTQNCSAKYITVGTNNSAFDREVKATEVALFPPENVHQGSNISRFKGSNSSNHFQLNTRR